MIHLVLSILISLVFYLAPGVIALIRAAGSPSGRGLVFAGGGLLVLCGLIGIGWRLWYHFAVLAPFGDMVAGGPLPYGELIDAFNIGFPVLVTAAIALLLFAVLSARDKGQSTAPAPHGFPQHQPAQGHHVPQHHPGHPGHFGHPGQPGHPGHPGQPYGHPGYPGQPYGHQAPGAPQQQFQAPQQPQPPQTPTGPQQPGQPQAPSGPQRPQPPQAPSGPQQPQPPQAPTGPQQPQGPQPDQR
ncbi:hypothetical protein [Nocardiopsis sp. FIRDI 009]|uniref:hypothetical protein n=1 Tax=Nocardiopsis sp. FIRDI 009 TaxID=714197 RepID=UPI000E2476AC|nr:hypothetical protein [Nocardiopsis sp. FIRDI 009]